MQKGELGKCVHQMWLSKAKVSLSWLYAIRILKQRLDDAGAIDLLPKYSDQDLENPQEPSTRLDWKTLQSIPPKCSDLHQFLMTYS